MAPTAIKVHFTITSLMILSMTLMFFFRIWQSNEPGPPKPAAFHMASPLATETQDFNIIFIKLHKCASSTTAGVVRNIASRRQMAGAITVWDFDGEPGAFSNHQDAREVMPYVRQLALPSFVLSFIRHPRERAISRWNHRAFAESIPHTDSHRIHYLKGIVNEMANYLSETTPVRSSSDIDAILDSLDFVGITERYDESLIVLKHLLDLDYFDLLYLPSKVSGDELLHPGRVGEKFREFSVEVQSFFNTSFAEANALDLELFDKANLRLNEEILRIGVGFHRELREFQSLLAEVRSACTAEQARKCLWWDNGCGIECFDEVEQRLHPDAPLPYQRQFSNYQRFHRQTT